MKKRPQASLSSLRWIAGQRATGAIQELNQQFLENKIFALPIIVTISRTNVIKNIVCGIDGKYWNYEHRRIK